MSSMNQEIDILLDEIIEVDGIIGAVASDLKGNIIALHMPPIYDYEEIEQTIRLFAKSLVNIRSNEISFDNCLYTFDEFQIRVDYLHTGYLLIISMNTVKAQFIRVATSGTRKKIGKILSGENPTNSPPAI